MILLTDEDFLVLVIHISSIIDCPEAEGIRNTKVLLTQKQKSC
ncbi:unnamed protein product, partial [Larinioides sclopetarius]